MLKTVENETVENSSTYIRITHGDDITGINKRHIAGYYTEDNNVVVNVFEDVNVVFSFNNRKDALAFIDMLEYIE